MSARYHSKQCDFQSRLQPMYRSVQFLHFLFVYCYVWRIISWDKSVQCYRFRFWKERLVLRIFAINFPYVKEYAFFHSKQWGLSVTGSRRFISCFNFFIFEFHIIMFSVLYLDTSPYNCIFFDFGKSFLIYRFFPVIFRTNVCVRAYKLQLATARAHTVDVYLSVLHPKWNNS